MRVGKRQSFRTYSNTCCYQLKTGHYKNTLLYIRPMVTTKQKPIADKGSLQITNEEKEKRKNYKTARKKN